jgi:hypothetical protein
LRIIPYPRAQDCGSDIKTSPGNAQSGSQSWRFRRAQQNRALLTLVHKTAVMHPAALYKREDEFEKRFSGTESLRK